MDAVPSVPLMQMHEGPSFTPTSHMPIVLTSRPSHSFSRVDLATSDEEAAFDGLLHSAGRGIVAGDPEGRPVPLKLEEECVGGEAALRKSRRPAGSIVAEGPWHAPPPRATRVFIDGALKELKAFEGKLSRASWRVERNQRTNDQSACPLTCMGNGQ